MHHINTHNRVIYELPLADVCQSHKSECHSDLQLMQLISFYGYVEFYEIILLNPDVLVFIIHCRYADDNKAHTSQSLRVHCFTGFIGATPLKSQHKQCQSETTLK